MFAERFGNDALKRLKAEQKTSVEQAKKDAAAAKKAGGTSGNVEADAVFAERLFSRLAEVMPADGTALAKLADARAQAVVAELSRAGRIPPERIEVKPSQPDEGKGPVRAKLNLGGKKA
jgi:hypothetical protein